MTHVSIEPKCGPPGTKITVIYSGYCYPYKFTSGFSAQMFLDNVNVGYLSQETGGCTQTITIPTTSSTGTLHNIAIRETGGASQWMNTSIEFNFQIVEPEITRVTPTSGMPYDNITVEGKNFPVKTYILYYVGGFKTGKILSTPQGTISGLVSLPGLSAGSYNVEFDWAGRPVGMNLPSFTVLIKPAPAIVINLNAVPTKGDFPLDVNFPGSIFGGLGDYSYTFDPGDGSQPQTGKWNNEIGLITLNHQYQNPGSYIASILIRDLLNTQQTRFVNIQVNDPADQPPPVDTFVAPPPPIAPPPPPPTLPPPTLPVPPTVPVPPTLPDQGLLQMRPDLNTFFVDKYNDAQVTFFGEIKGYKRGVPVVLEILEPDGRKDNRGIVATKSGEFSLLLTIRDNWLKGKYSVTAIYGDDVLGTITFEVARKKSLAEQSAKPVIPITVKQVAQWWGRGQVSDMEFANNIGFMIQEKLIKVPGYDVVDGKLSGVSEHISIPGWIKNIAVFWADDAISDDEFLTAIEYMLKNDIIDLKGKKRAELLGISP